MGNKPSRRAGLLKAGFLLLFLVGAILVVRFTGLKEFFSASRLDALVQSAGILAPLAFILFYAAGVCLFIPGTLLTAL